MRAIVTAALAASLAAAVVFELDPDNFDASITSGGPWIVEFYAPWCTHCKRLEPHFEAASRAKEAAGARFGRVDGAAHRSLLMRFGVAGFPTIFHIDASGAVRPATINHSKQALVTLAKNGINATQALTGVANPNGPAKLAIFLFLKYGEKALGLHEPIAAKLGVPPIFVLFGFAVVGVVLLASVCIVAAVAMGPSKKRGVKRD